MNLSPNITLHEFFDYWLEYRKTYCWVKEKTIKEDIYLYKKYILGQNFLFIPIVELKANDFLTYFRLLTKNRTFTKKKFNNLKSVLNNILLYAVECEIITFNPLSHINYRQLAFKPLNHEIRAYTEDERNLLLSYIPENNLYDLAIKLDFHLCIRIGELLAISYSDIENNCLKICKMVNNKKIIENDIKGHCSTGIRYLPLSKPALAIIDKIKVLNPNSEYLFFVNGKGLDKNTFNRHLEKHCKALNIKYRSSHKIRFGVASILYKNGVSATEIQYLLGHSTLEMTLHYLRNIESMKDTFNKVCNILQFKQNRTPNNI